MGLLRLLESIATGERVAAAVFAAALIAAALIWVPRGAFAPEQFAQTLLFDLQRARYDAKLQGACSGVVIGDSGDLLLFADIDGDCRYDPATDITLGRSAASGARATMLDPADGDSLVFTPSGAPFGRSGRRAIAVQGQNRELLVCVDEQGRARAQERSC